MQNGQQSHPPFLSWPSLSQLVQSRICQAVLWGYFPFYSPQRSLPTSSTRPTDMQLSVYSTRTKHGRQTLRRYLHTLGFLVLMGIVREPEIRDYWSQSPLLHYSPIASRISRKRFEDISKYFHLVDNSTLPQRGQPGFHRLQKVKQVMDMVRKRFSSIYNPTACLSVDEAMVPFKGKLHTAVPLHFS